MAKGDSAWDEMSWTYTSEAVFSLVFLFCFLVAKTLDVSRMNARSTAIVFKQQQQAGDDDVDSGALCALLTLW